jgi:hypothetical protein
MKRSTVRGPMAMLCIVCTALTLAACGTSTDGRSSEVLGRYSPASPPRVSSAPATIAEPHAARGGVPARVHANLPASRLPAYATESWKAEALGPVRSVDGHEIKLNECATIHGASTWQQQPYWSSGGNSAVLEIYTFSSPAAAQSAAAGLRSGMRSCQATSRALQAAQHLTVDAVAEQTANAGTAAAFRRAWTGVAGLSASGPQVNHLYVATRGSAVMILHFEEFKSARSAAGAYDVHNDPSVLTLLADLLAAR